MQIVVDDPTLPISGWMSAGLGYLFGLSVVGYANVMAWIKRCGLRESWPAWLVQLAVTLHAVIGIATVSVVPASLLHRLKLQGATSGRGGIAFAIVIFAVVFVGTLIMRDWYRWYSQPSGRTQRRP